MARHGHFIVSTCMTTDGIQEEINKLWEDGWEPAFILSATPASPYVIVFERRKTHKVLTPRCREADGVERGGGHAITERDRGTECRVELRCGCPQHSPAILARRLHFYRPFPAAVVRSSRIPY